MDLERARPHSPTLYSCLGLPRLGGRHPLTTAAPPSGARGDLSFWTSPQPEVRAARPLLGGPSGCSCQPTEAPRPGFVPQPRRVGVRGAAVSPAQSFGVVDMNDELPTGGGKARRARPTGADAKRCRGRSGRPPPAPPGVPPRDAKPTPWHTEPNAEPPQKFPMGPMGTYGDVWE